MQDHGYYRYPVLAGEHIVFVSDDDLWCVPREGGRARRLTASLGEISHPVVSPDGNWLAFTCHDEGSPEIYVMPAEGGEARRLTHLGSRTHTAGWSPDGERIHLATDHGTGLRGLRRIMSVGREGGLPVPEPFGSANAVAFGPSGGVVLGRHVSDPATWKRYRGGTVGQIWIDRKGTGAFQRLRGIEGNLARPMWLGSRVWFVSDHEGVGNLYSSDASGKGVKRHTDHVEYYVRHAWTDGKQVVYMAGGDVWVCDPHEDRPEPVNIRLGGSRPQRGWRFVDAEDHLEHYDLHPKGHLLALVARGQVFTGGPWEGPLQRVGHRPGRRLRLARWTRDGKRLLAVSGDGGTETFVSLDPACLEEPTPISPEPEGRPVDLVSSPTDDRFAYSDHTGRLWIQDPKKKKAPVLVDRSEYGQIAGFGWSPDGRWLAYALPVGSNASVLRLHGLSDKVSHTITRPVLFDFAPAFDPEGRYLYFLSRRVFDPVYDKLHFELGFPRGMKPYLICLAKGTRSPFHPLPQEPDEDEKSKSGKKKGAWVKIDLEGIEDRVLEFPVEEGIYEAIAGLHKGRVLFSSQPVEGSRGDDIFDDSVPSAEASLQCYDFQELKLEDWVDGMSDFGLSMDGKHLIYRSGHSLRVTSTSEKPKSDASEGPGRSTGWVDLDRARVRVDPTLEWKQMFTEAWRLQKEHYWVEDLAGVDWDLVRDRYEPLVDRVGSRRELSDLIWEMQGELGSSHAYEFGGDHRRHPNFRIGHLGADLTHDPRKDGYRIEHIVRGDCWERGACSPLLAPGLDVAVGDVILSIDGVRLSRQITPHQLLVDRAGEDVVLQTVRGRKVFGEQVVRTLSSERKARYREWVDSRREQVHQATRSRVGYLHIPDMGPDGFAEFHRYYLPECQRQALIVDVRYNGGGHVSGLLLEKLLRRRIGYSIPRWGRPESYPEDAPLGPIVALTNELAGSDGDIFSHSFKLFGMGPLIGTRTWGGVIGIWPRHRLMDGSITTQPEYSFWFQDVGWGVENHGTDPDIEVEIRPQDEVRGEDPQLERAIREALAGLKSAQPQVPRFPRRPSRKLPSRLPPRS